MESPEELSLNVRLLVMCFESTLAILVKDCHGIYRLLSSHVPQPATSVIPHSSSLIMSVTLNGHGLEM